MPTIHEDDDDDDDLVDDEDEREDGDEEKTAGNRESGERALGGPWVARDSSFSIIGRAVSTPNHTKPRV